MGIIYIDGIRLDRSITVRLKKVITRQDNLNKINVFPASDGDKSNYCRNGSCSCSSFWTGGLVFSVQAF